MGSPQTANSMALALGLVPAGQEPAVLDRIVQDIRKRGNQQTAGDIGFWYLLQALARTGPQRRHLRHGRPHRHGQLRLHRPQRLDLDARGLGRGHRRSMNHCMLGHIQEWFLGWVAGIRPEIASPGFRRFIIDPHPVGSLTWARAQLRFDPRHDPLRLEQVGRGLHAQRDDPARHVRRRICPSRPRGGCDGTAVRPPRRPPASDFWARDRARCDSWWTQERTSSHAGANDDSPLRGREEREEVPDLLVGGPAAVFADLERLGVADLAGLLLAVPFDKLLAELVGRPCERAVETSADLLLVGLSSLWIRRAGFLRAVTAALESLGRQRRWPNRVSSRSPRRCRPRHPP